jgi:hypothetical protein|tara:strand:- start:2796 stop:3479 length:684 start_codon:yes stop_codon:yes gene_type:complete
VEFNNWFESIASKLGDREISFRKIFKYLDSQPTPIIIVETGCLRDPDNFQDGQSTLLFDKYTSARGENSKVYTVDINPACTSACKKIVSKNVEISTEDSVRYLNKISNKFLKNKTKVILFYLDSFDLDWRYPYPSAAHHLKELTAINRILHKDTMVVVDDSPASANITQTDKADQNNKSDNWKILLSPSPAPTIGGKGFLVHEYASHVGAQLIFSHYQAAWKGFNKE